METENQKPNEIINPIDTRSDEEKMKEIIKKYSRQTKTYPQTEYIHPDCPGWVLDRERRNLWNNIRAKQKLIFQWSGGIGISFLEFKSLKLSVMTLIR